MMTRISNAIHQQRHRQEQPGLVASTTEDSDSVVIPDPRDNNSQQTFSTDTSSHLRNRDNVAHLLRYESIVKQQEAEELAILAYLRPMLERLELLGRGGENYNDNDDNTTITNKSMTTTNNDEHSDLASRVITLCELQRALEILDDSDKNFLSKDRQFMMVVRTVACERKINNNTVINDSDENVGITWAELVHCYRLCVIGMLTLQHLPKPSAVRDRTKERILSQISLFELQPEKPANPSTRQRSGNGTDLVERHTHSGNTRGFMLGVIGALLVGLFLGLSSQTVGLQIHPSLSEVTNESSRGRHQPSSDETAKYSNTSHVETNATTMSIHPPRSAILTTVVPPRAALDAQKLPVAQLAPYGDSTDVEEAVSRSLDDKEGAGKATITAVTQNPVMVPTVVGVVAGSVGARAFVAAGQSVYAVFSLGNLGIVPASLVVVGAVAVVSLAAAAIHSLVIRLVKRH